MMYLIHLALLLLVAVEADEATCANLRSLNAASIGFVDSDCACSDPTAETTREICSSCFQSTSSTAFKGIATSTAIKDRTGTSFSQRTDVELCFQYEEGVYRNAKVCYSYFLFGGNQDSQCTITVDGASCNRCQTFTKTTLAFDCSNLNYETRQNALVADAVQGTVLHFLSNTKSASGCATITSGGGRAISSSIGSGLLPGVFVPIAASLLHHII